MKRGLSRFNFYLVQIQVLLTKASKQKNPALWLFQNNLRTPLFMIEGLAKMHIDFHNKKKFTKIKEQFKQLEDALGSIDYYDTFAKELSNNKIIPKEITGYLQAQAREKIQSLNEILIEEKWIGNEKSRISKIQKKLHEARWLKESDEIYAIDEYYGKAIYEIAAFIQKTGPHFDNVEEDVHELRRKLRWLSIYPQAFRGSIQLSINKPCPKHLIKYQTKEITSSPFNIFPEAGNLKYFLLLDQQYFYSLSWIIATLGKLKDTGLRVIAIKEAILQTGTLTENEALQSAYQYAGTKQMKLTQILKNASAITHAYFNEQNLEHLVIGTSKIK